MSVRSTTRLIPDITRGSDEEDGEEEEEEEMEHRVVEVSLAGGRGIWRLALQRRNATTWQLWTVDDASDTLRSGMAPGIRQRTITLFYYTDSPKRYVREVRVTPEQRVSQEFIAWMLIVEKPEDAMGYAAHMCETKLATRTDVIRATQALMDVNDAASRMGLEKWLAEFFRRTGVVWRWSPPTTEMTASATAQKTDKGEAVAADTAATADREVATRIYSLESDCRVASPGREHECAPTLLYELWFRGWVAAPRLLRTAALLLRVGYSPADLCSAAFRQGRRPWRDVSTEAKVPGAAIVIDKSATTRRVDGSGNGDSDVAAVSVLAALLSTGKIRVTASAKETQDEAGDAPLDGGGGATLPPRPLISSSIDAQRPPSSSSPSESVTAAIGYGIAGVERVDSGLVVAAVRLLAARDFARRHLAAPPHNVPSAVAAVVCEYAYEFVGAGAIDVVGP
jgi:hypothetical protein